MATVIPDAIWPGLAFTEGLLKVWVVVIGLVVEFLFVRRLTTLNASMCAIADITMNAVSTLLGAILVPLAGYTWDSLVYQLFEIGALNTGTLAVTFVFVVILNATMELTVLRVVFRQRVSKRVFWWLCLANVVSVGVAFGGIIMRLPYV